LPRAKTMNSPIYPFSRCPHRRRMPPMVISLIRSQYW
jgi:hypothetical protein